VVGRRLLVLSDDEKQSRRRLLVRDKASVSPSPLGVVSVAAAAAKGSALARSTVAGLFDP
jgi:hypothetical protein